MTEDYKRHPWPVHNLDADETAKKLMGLNLGGLSLMEGLLKAEIDRRRAVRLPPPPDPERLAGGWTAFSNFLLGCARAMACRAELRASKGHKPFCDRVAPMTPGGTPTGGTMWTASDGVTAAVGCQRVGTTLDQGVGTRTWARAYRGVGEYLRFRSK